ncbi:hypothetical protein C0J52_03027 [Blattella germanica]|nr:hypothetical protein C0J52_03027 [Blattella germanica]
MALFSLSSLLPTTTTRLGFLRTTSVQSYLLLNPLLTLLLSSEIVTFLLLSTTTCSLTMPSLVFTVCLLSVPVLTVHLSDNLPGFTHFCFGIRSSFTALLVDPHTVSSSTCVVTDGTLF